MIGCVVSTVVNQATRASRGTLPGRLTGHLAGKLAGKLTWRRAGVAIAALGLSACAGGPSLDLIGGGANYAAGSPLGVSLPTSDQRSLSPQFVSAMTNGAAGERYDWRGEASFGWVKAGERVLGNVKASRHDRPPYPDRLYLEEPMETELGLYAATRNANVRLGPSTDYPVQEMLDSGDAVYAVGRVIGKRWILIEKQGRVAGYVFEGLLRKAPGTELELAGGPTKTATPCRRFEQRISFGGRSDRWTGVACLEGRHWVLQPTPAEPSYLY